MTEAPISTGQQLFQGILEGQVPRQVRLFAAQGLLPVPREELYRLQILLTADPDQELAATARRSLEEHPEETFIAWLKDANIDSLTLDLLPRVRKEEPIWSAVASHPNVSDETLRVLARHGSPTIQDIIMTNQVRVMACLEILDDLKANERAAPVVMRRVREFEEEFIEKAIAEQARLEAASDRAVSIDDALQALRGIGANIPHEKSMPYGTIEDPLLDAEVEKQGTGLYGRLADMSIREKVLCALRGSREERAILINSRSRLVVNAVLASPRLGDAEVERFAQSRTVSEEVIRIIASNRRWMRLYGVVLALVQNPKAPLQNALRLLNQINHRDLSRVARNRNVHPVVRRRAGELSSLRR